MNEFRVPTICLAVDIRCVDGCSVVGDIFLPARSSLKPGPMRLEEWSDTVPTFFPVRSRDTHTTTLMNRDAVVALTVPAAANEDADKGLSGSLVFRVAVDAGGERFEGDIMIDMPPQYSRVADWLNAPCGFITLRTGGVHHLIQKRHVARVVELDGGRG